MANDDDAALPDSSDGGVTGPHPDVDLMDLLVAPATGDESNRVKLPLIPIACWKIEDIRFAFDSSFLAPEAAGEFQTLDDLREKNAKSSPGAGGAGDSTKYPPLSIFGHADPVGADTFNKSLSGRRATVVYAVLIVNSDAATAVGLWQQVAKAENWGDQQQQVMRGNVPDGTADGDLYEAYMKTLCPADLALTPDDFLSSGDDSKGKYQGCSSFNPVLIFSQQKEDKYAAAESSGNKAVLQTRNDENAPNRRVMILLFRVGSKVLPDKWPCPRATEGIGGCQKRFWGNGADGETRRTTHLPTDDRVFEQTEDTFACRFYQRITDQSPCHKLLPVKPCDQKAFPPRNVDRPVTEVISGAPAPYTKWNNTYSWHSKFTVVVTRNPCQVRVIVKLKITGAITSGQKAAWKSAIEGKWNGKVTLYCQDAACAQACPDGYPVKINIEYVTRREHQEVAAVADTLDMGNWGVDDTVDVTHEFGHMLGNPEEYFTTNGVNYSQTVNGVVYGFRSPNGTVMNNPANNPVPRHYDFIRQEAGKAMGITCSFKKPKVLGDFPTTSGDSGDEGVA